MSEAGSMGEPKNARVRSSTLRSIDARYQARISRPQKTRPRNGTFEVRRLLSRSLVGLVQPPQRVAQVLCGTYVERKPALPGSDSCILQSALLQILRDGIEPENHGVAS